MRSPTAANAASPGAGPPGGSAAAACGVATVGVGARTRELLDHLLRHDGGRFRLCAPQEARIALLDLDAADCVDTWDAMRAAHPGLAPLCLGTRRDDSPDGVEFVAKPIEPARLLAAIERCARRAATADAGPIGHAMLRPSLAAAAAEPAEAARSQYDPASYLVQLAIDTLAEARRRGAPMVLELRGAARRRLVFDPAAGGSVYVGIPSTLLHGLACTIDVRAQVTVTPGDATPVAGMERMEPDALVWDLAVLASHGRVPRGTDPHRRLRLRRWPNLTRWIETPGAMMLADRWSRGATLDRMRRDAGVPSAAVDTFYAACCAVGLFESSGEPAGHWDRLAGAAAAPGQLLSRLARRLLGLA